MDDDRQMLIARHQGDAVLELIERWGSQVTSPTPWRWLTGAPFMVMQERHALALVAAADGAEWGEGDSIEQVLVDVASAWLRRFYVERARQQDAVALLGWSWPPEPGEDVEELTLAEVERTPETEHQLAEVLEDRRLYPFDTIVLVARMDGQQLRPATVAGPFLHWLWPDDEALVKPGRIGVPVVYPTGWQGDDVLGLAVDREPPFVVEPVEILAAWARQGHRVDAPPGAPWALDDVAVDAEMVPARSPRVADEPEPVAEVVALPPPPLALEEAVRRESSGSMVSEDDGWQPDPFAAWLRR